MDFSDSEERFGASAWTVHRVDLHQELLHLATKDTTEGERPVELILDARVVSTDADQGYVELEDGSKHHADLIIAADGLHSVLKGEVLGQEAAKASPTGLSAFRFLIDTGKLEGNEKLRRLLREKRQGSTILADTKDVSNERHMVWYDCRKYDIYAIAILRCLKAFN